MFDLGRTIVVTNRRLCRGDFLERVGAVCRLRPLALILREKDLAEGDYEELAKRVLPLCAEQGVLFFAHTFIEAARRLGCGNLHLPLPALRTARLDGFRRISVSCHSVEDVLEAQGLGATQALLGNIYETDCKKGLPGKGLGLLREARAVSAIPLYAIGGIRPERMPEVLRAGASGGCMMSWFMRPSP